MTDGRRYPAVTVPSFVLPVKSEDMLFQTGIFVFCRLIRNNSISAQTHHRPNTSHKP
nr:hypothetical protein [Neisseria yangbaofengii]